MKIKNYSTSLPSYIVTKIDCGFGGMQYTNVCNPSANVDDLD